MNWLSIFVGIVLLQSAIIRVPQVRTVSTTTDTLSATDNTNMVRYTSSSDVTVTVSTGLPIGFRTTLMQSGSGRIHVVESGTTLAHPQGYNESNGVGAVIDLISPNTNAFIIRGEDLQKWIGTPSITQYGGFTGGGTIATFSTCSGSNQASALQAALDALSSGGTLDLTCKVPLSGFVHVTGINKRIRSSNGSGGLFATNTGVIGNSPYSSLLYVHDCDKFLIDGLDIDVNGKKAQGIYMQRCSNSSIQNDYAHNAAYDSGGPPFALIKADGGAHNWFVSNTLSDTTGIAGGEAVRGLWIGVNGDSFESDPHILNNTGTHLAHTCIVTESSGPLVSGNSCSDMYVTGTGYKFIHRGPQVDAIFENNSVTGTLNGGFQVEASNASHIYIRNGSCTNVGDTGTTFGCVYINNPTTYNLSVSGMTLTNCKALANVNQGQYLSFTNNTIVSGSGVIHLENDAQHIVISNSGTVDIGSNVSDVVVDGSVVASVLRNPLTLLALAKKGFL